MVITQTLIKAYLSMIKNKSCEKKFIEYYINRSVQETPSNAMMLGMWFEYCLLGNIPAYGTKIKPKELKNGKLSSQYESAKEKSDIIKELIDTENITHKGIYKEKIITEDNITIGGTLDFITTINDTKYVVDIKYTSLIEDRWSEFGWHKDAIIKNPLQIIQSYHYNILFDMPVVYLLIDSTKNNIYKYQFIDVENIDDYYNVIYHLHNYIINISNIKNNKRLSESIVECSKCRVECKHRKMNIPFNSFNLFLDFDAFLS